MVGGGSGTQANLLPEQAEADRPSSASLAVAAHTNLQQDCSADSPWGTFSQNSAPGEPMPGALQLKGLLNYSCSSSPNIYQGNNVQKVGVIIGELRLT